MRACVIRAPECIQKQDILETDLFSSLGMHAIAAPLARKLRKNGPPIEA